MAHPRQEIRHAVAAQLVNKTAAGDRVFKTRVLPYRREFPALAVYTPTENVKTDTDSAPRELERSPELVVEGAAQVTSAENADDVLDALAWEIEQALHADPTFGGTAADSRLVSSELDVFPEGEQMVGIVKLTYAVTYYAYAAGAPTLDDLKTVDIRQNLGNAVHPSNQAHDVLSDLDE